MAKDRKKAIREAVRTACLRRDHNRCVLCVASQTTPVEELEIHHITNRNEMPNGGYVLLNCITLCPHHHAAVEREYTPLTRRLLYILINSDEKRARERAEAL